MNKVGLHFSPQSAKQTVYFYLGLYAEQSFISQRNIASPAQESNGPPVRAIDISLRFVSLDQYRPTYFVCITSID